MKACAVLGLYSLENGKKIEAIEALTKACHRSYHQPGTEVYLPCYELALIWNNPPKGEPRFDLVTEFSWQGCTHDEIDTCGLYGWMELSNGEDEKAFNALYYGCNSGSGWSCYQLGMGVIMAGTIDEMMQLGDYFKKSCDQDFIYACIAHAAITKSTIIDKEKITSIITSCEEGEGESCVWYGKYLQNQNDINATYYIRKGQKLLNKNCIEQDKASCRLKSWAGSI